ncbi:unnamed protein product [Ixodes persulcatus]
MCCTMPAMHLAPSRLSFADAHTHTHTHTQMLTFVCCSHAVQTDDVEQVSKLQQAKLETIQASFCARARCKKGGWCCVTRARG